MAIDHFKAHYYQKDRVDWNFNILLDDQPDVIRMVNEYAPLLVQEGLYPSIPAKWLHMTILRVGLTDDYTEDEMYRTADILAPKLATLKLPQLSFDSWWQWGGNIVFHISPHDDIVPVYNAVIESLRQVVGNDRTARTPHGNFIPHVSLAYTKDHHNEMKIIEVLSQSNIKPARFYAKSLSLLRQRPTDDGHYEWQIVKDMPIGVDGGTNILSGSGMR